jgi:hypothetical protein
MIEPNARSGSAFAKFLVELDRTRLPQHYAQRNLAFASLRVMEHDLRFNMCNLKSSYLPNSEDTGLSDQIATCIPSHLSYSSRYWATHVGATEFDTELAKEIGSFFEHEWLLFWIESLGLLNALSVAVGVLPLISQWLKVRTESVVV